MEFKLSAVYRPVPEGYVAWIEEVPGVQTQGATFEEARENLRDALAIVLAANRDLARREGDQPGTLREYFRVMVDEALRTPAAP